MRKSARACDTASRAKTAAKKKRLTLRLPRPLKGAATGDQSSAAVLRHTAPRNDPLKAWSAAGLSPYCTASSLSWPSRRRATIEGADQVHLVSGLVAEHLASLAVVADIKPTARAGEANAAIRTAATRYSLIVYHSTSVGL